MSIEPSTDNCYNYLINDLIKPRGLNETTSRSIEFNSSESQIPSEHLIKFKLVKQKLKYLLTKKLSYFVEQQKKATKVIEVNEKLGNRILKNLEQSGSLSTVEMDKYKLLVSESDVINNLLLKLGNKLATIENSIQIVELKHLQYTKYEAINYCSEMSPECVKEIVSYCSSLNYLWCYKFTDKIEKFKKNYYLITFNIY